MDNQREPHRPVIIGPGSLNVDITGYAARLPREGETVPGSHLRFSPGGKGNNQMTAAHRAGAETYIIGCRGEDTLGDILHAHYVGEGMSEAYINVRADVETASALIEIDETTGQNRIMVVLSANERIDRARVMACEELFASSDVILTQFETTTEAVVAAKELAGKHHKPFILNPAPFREVPSALFDGVDYVTPNETEAEAFTGVHIGSTDDCRRAADVFFSYGVKNVVITLGSKGLYYTDGKQELTIPCIPVRAVNTTGAGDAFNGGFAVALAEGYAIADALRFATCTSALSVTREGAAASMPHREEILALYRETYGELPSSC